MKTIISYINAIFTAAPRFWATIFIFMPGLLAILLGMMISPDQPDPDKMYPGDWVSFAGFALIILAVFIILVLSIVREHNRNRKGGQS